MVSCDFLKESEYEDSIFSALVTFEFPRVLRTISLIFISRNMTKPLVLQRHHNPLL